MNQLLAAIESVKRIESSNFFNFADRHHAHTTLGEIVDEFTAKVEYIADILSV